MIGWVPPGLVTGVLVVLVLSFLFSAFWPGPPSRYVAVLVLTAAGVVAGQAWDMVGLPALRMGQVNLVPGVLIAAGLQPLRERVSLRLPQLQRTAVSPGRRRGK